MKPGDLMIVTYFCGFNHTLDELRFSDLYDAHLDSGECIVLLEHIPEGVRKVAWKVLSRMGVLYIWESNIRSATDEAR